MSARTMGRWTLVLGTLAAGAAQGADSGAGVSGFVADDSEGFATRRLSLGYLPAYTSGDLHTGVRVAGSHFAQDGWQRDAQQISVVRRDLDAATTDGLQLEAGYSRQGGRGLLTLDAGYRKAVAQHTSVEVFLNRDWVETRRALDEGVRFTFGGVAVEQGIGQHVTVVGLAGYQDFSDGNHRSHGRLRLIVQPSLDLGLTLQARLRTYRSASDSAPRAYFNPSRYDEAMLALGFRKRFAGNMASVTAGVGRQRVGDAERTATRLLEAAWETPRKAKSSLRLRAGYNRSAAFGGPDYSYRYAQAEWLMAF
jgi:hypothetical protein